MIIGASGTLLIFGIDKSASFRLWAELAKNQFLTPFARGPVPKFLCLRGNGNLYGKEIVMNEVTFSMLRLSLDPAENSYEVLSMKRGQRRRLSYHLIIIETLRALSGKPTRDQLQKFSKIRRKRFIPVLRHLLEIGSVLRTGTGTKFDPFLYELGGMEVRR
jgi:hypothetical protein